MASRAVRARDDRARLASSYVPFVPWTKLQSHLERTWERGQHVALIGKTGCGKTHLGYTLADIRRDVIIAATKQNDDLLSAAISEGYKAVSTIDEVPMTETGHPVYHKVIDWPGRGVTDKATRIRMQAAEFRHMFDVAERQRFWTILLDETMWIYDMLRLRADLDAVWYQGRSSGVSLVASAQRPTKVPRLMISSASHLFLWYVSDKRDLEPLREIAGMTPPEVIEATLPSLSWERHEFLYIGADSGYIARSIAPPR